MTEKQKFLYQLVVLDTETTSLDFREAEVIELGFSFMDDGVWKYFGELYKPSNSISAEVSAVTNITDEMVENCYSFKNLYKDFDSTVSLRSQYSGTPYIVAHNAFYDSKVLEHGYPETDVLNYNWLCTMRMAKKLFADDDTVTQYNLPYLRYRFKLDIPKNMPHHRASSDAYMTAKLIEFLIEVMEIKGLLIEDEPYDKQIEIWLNEPVIMTKMPMGKHKGKLLTEVPLDYWQWAFKNLDSLNEDKDEYDADFAASVVKALDEKL
jgi:exodeoxyribonuclease X